MKKKSLDSKKLNRELHVATLHFILHVWINFKTRLAAISLHVNTPLSFIVLFSFQLLEMENGKVVDLAMLTIKSTVLSQKLGTRK